MYILLIVLCIITRNIIQHILLVILRELYHGQMAIIKLASYTFECMMAVYICSASTYRIHILCMQILAMYFVLGSISINYCISTVTTTVMILSNTKRRKKRNGIRPVLLLLFLGIKPNSSCTNRTIHIPSFTKA